MNWFQDKLGPECSALGSYHLGDSIVAYVVYRGMTLAAASTEGLAAASRALEQKILPQRDQLQVLPEICAAHELNLVLESGVGGAPSRRFIRPKSCERARIELELGVDGSHVFIDSASSRISIASFNQAGLFEVLHVGEPVLGDDDQARPLPIPGRTPDNERESELRRDKRSRMRALLRCPLCLGNLSDIDVGLACQSCDRRYLSYDGRPVLAQSADYDAASQGIPKSQNPYGQQCLSLIEQYRDGWVLDCGSGSPSLGFYNVIHLDLHAHPQVDLVTDGAVLPFAGGTFDCVLSEAVLEHVRDPWGYVRELARVLKPGGRVRLDVAFLQPYHGYPDHYFNMTRSGLELVLEQAGFEPEYLDVGPHQQPFVVLSALLNGYVQGTVNPDKRQRILAMSIQEAIETLASGQADPFDGLQQSAIDRFASGFECVAIRK